METQGKEGLKYEADKNHFYRTGLTDSQDTCEVLICFQDGEQSKCTYDKMEKLDISADGIILKDKVIGNVELPSRDELPETKAIKFENCIFIENCDWNFHDFNSQITFHNCVFMDNVCVFGDFNEVVSFGGVTFIIISEDYLKSMNCMYEIGEFTKDENYKDRILPIVNKGANIFNPIGRLGYSIYWQDEYQKLEARANELDSLHRNSVNMDLHKIDRIRKDLTGFLEFLSDINVIIYDGEFTEEYFEKIWKEIHDDLY